MLALNRSVLHATQKSQNRGFEKTNQNQFFRADSY
jgi:hypothetical protein